MSDQTPVMKMELKRADASELIKADPLLASSPLVKALGLAPLAKGTLRRYPDKAVVMQQGDHGSSLMFVMKGEARLFARRDRDSVELGHAHRGDVLGEGEALGGAEERRCSAVAQGQLDVLELPRTLLVNQGRVPAALEAFLKGVHDKRMKALDEMSDFLNRW